MTDKKSSESRRKLLKSIAAGSGAIVAGKSLPDKWTAPIVDAVLLPSHAQTSPSPPTGCPYAYTIAVSDDEGSYPDGSTLPPGLYQLQVQVSPQAAISLDAARHCADTIQISGQITTNAQGLWQSDYNFGFKPCENSLFDGFSVTYTGCATVKWESAIEGRMMPNY